MIAFDVHSLDLASFDSIGIGPGMGIEKVELLDLVLTSFDRPIVLDADALTILANHPDLQVKIPKGSILTPHLGEFERLFGKCENHSERLIRARDFCTDLQINMVIKGANSAICLSNGKVYFNSTGSVYMATAGMGDILTGMLTSFLGQGYSPEAAMVCGVYQHGLAGELAGEEKLRSTIASDLIEKIPHSFKKLGIR
jgi:NAD(P)H-hydrate epimerase